MFCEVALARASRERVPQNPSWEIEFGVGLEGELDTLCIGAMEGFTL